MSTLGTMTTITKEANYSLVSELHLDPAGEQRDDNRVFIAMCKRNNVRCVRSLGFNRSKLYFCPSDIHPTFFFSMPISILFSSCVSFVTFSALFIYIRRWGGELQSLYWLLVIICLFLCDLPHLPNHSFIATRRLCVSACLWDLYLYSCTWGDVWGEDSAGEL